MMTADALIPRLLAGERPGRPQPTSDQPELPARRPRDGAVDWRQPARSVYNTIRALTRPYPGAFSHVNGRCYRIWEAALLPSGLVTDGHRPGTVLGPVHSPRADACGLAVACDPGAILLLDLEDEDGVTLRGPHLSECPWAGKTWETPDAV